MPADALPTATIITPAVNGTVSTKMNGDKLHITGTFTDDMTANYLQLQLVGHNSGNPVGLFYHVGTPFTTGGPFSYDLAVPADIADGQYTLTYIPSDYNTTTGGQFGAQGQVVFYIDNTAPKININNAFGGDVASGIFREVSFGYYDANKAAYAVFNEGQPNAKTHNFGDAVWSNTDTVWANRGWTGLQQGVNTVTLYDVVGNKTVRTFTIDVTDPEVGLVAPVGTTNASSVEVKGWANDDNIRYYACYITTNQPITAFGQNWTVGQEPKDAGNSLADADCVTKWTSINVGDSSNPVTLGNFNIAGLPDGIYTIHMHAHDLAGNQKEATTVFTIDRTAPAVTVNSVSDGTDTTPTITGTVDTDAVSVRISFDGGATWQDAIVSGTTWSYAVTTPLAVGSHTVLAVARDAVGNESSSDTSTPQPYWTQFNVTTVAVNTPAQTGGTTTPVNGETQTTPAGEVLGEQDEATDDQQAAEDAADESNVAKDDEEGEALGAEDEATWSAYNLVAAVASLIIGAVALLGLGKGRKSFKIVVAVLAAASVVTFLVVEDLSLAMGWHLNTWTAVLAVAVIAQVALAVAANKEVE